MFKARLPSRTLRSKQLFDFGWKFHRGEARGAERPGFNDQGWKDVDLPHDWSIEDIPPTERIPFIRFTRGEWKFHKGDRPDWKHQRLDDRNWETIIAPADWKTHSKYTKKNAYGWYRRNLEIPYDLRGRDFVLDLGLIGEVSQVFLNGRMIGGNGRFPPRYKAPDWWLPLTRCTIKANWIKPGRNTVAVRVFSKMGKPQAHCAGGRGGLLEEAPQGDAKGPFDPLSVSSWATGYTVGGRGWYRKTFEIPREWRGKRLHLHFDGIYMDSKVWFNGKLLAEQPYGYSSFGMELNKNIRWGTKNTISVQVRNDGMNSRWYTGSGIYRHAWLTVSHSSVHITHRGITIQTPVATTRMAEVVATTRIRVPKGEQAITITTELFDPSGKAVAKTESAVRCRGEKSFTQTLHIEDPKLWSIDTPHLYTARTRIYAGRTLVDAEVTPFGVRSFDFSAEAGFRLNGKQVFLRGGCLHHDHGILGAKAFDAAEDRRVRILKEHGFNAVRTAHNPPSESFLEACDRQGLLVIAEAFDMWQEKTNKNDYHRHHQRWWRKDLKALVDRDKNHPSVLMWSIGNEVSGKLKPKNRKLARDQADFVRNLDPTRPVTEGLSGNKAEWKVMDDYQSRLDVPGYNYGYDRYHQDHRRVPGRVIYQSESNCEKMFESWEQSRDQPYVIGDFAWTGWDYIGEASIGWCSFDLRERENKLWTLAYCGDIDICGYKRPQNDYRETLWGTGDNLAIVVHSPEPTFGPSPMLGKGWSFADVHPHWTWTGNEGKKMTVVVFTRCEKVELRLNGRKIGTRKVGKETRFTARFSVPYKPGQLLARGFTAGKKVTEQRLVTAGPAAGLRLRAEKNRLTADGQHLAFVHVEVVDAKGRRVPTARVPVTVEVEGAANLVGFGTGHPRNLDSFQDSVHTTFEGRALLALRSLRRPGLIQMRAVSPGLNPASLLLKAHATTGFERLMSAGV